MRWLCIAMLLGGLLAPSRARAAADDLTARFEAMDAALNGGSGYADALNTAGELAWGESYVMLAYVEMYRATRDPSYLAKLVQHFDRVLKSRDDARHAKDYYRAVALRSWGSDRYSGGRWHVWAVHTGMICWGPVEFVGIVKGNRLLNRKLGPKADEYLARIQEAVAVHDPEWRDGPEADEGHYRDPGIGPLPLNQQNALGIVMLGLYRVTRDHLYRDRVARLAAYMKHRLRRQSDGAYDWAYAPGHAGSAEGSEDISHASINVEFALQCARSHIVFNAADMKALARTWAGHVRRSPGQWADTVGGGGGTNTHMPQAAGQWLHLAEWDPAIAEDARAAYADVPPERASGPNLLAIARLAAWQARKPPRRR